MKQKILNLCLGQHISRSYGFVAEVTFIDITHLHIPRVGTLVPEDPCCVFYAIRCHVYLGLTHNVVF